MFTKNFLFHIYRAKERRLLARFILNPGAVHYTSQDFPGIFDYWLRALSRSNLFDSLSAVTVTVCYTNLRCWIDCLVFLFHKFEDFLGHHQTSHTKASIERMEKLCVKEISFFAKESSTTYPEWMWVIFFLCTFGENQSRSIHSFTRQSVWSGVSNLKCRCTTQWIVVRICWKPAVMELWRSQLSGSKRIRTSLGWIVQWTPASRSDPSWRIMLFPENHRIDSLWQHLSRFIFVH